MTPVHSIFFSKSQHRTAAVANHTTTSPLFSLSLVHLDQVSSLEPSPLSLILFDEAEAGDEHGPLTVAQTWDRVKEVGLRGLMGKSHMKLVLRWMRERQKLRLTNDGDLGCGDGGGADE
ncbi:hypothetical protein Q3G72_012651 [Acer saccharum]|nr:hypothetical protein Q3G72_012651 [Acer saccharum]